MAYFVQIMLCAKIYITIKILLFVNLQQIKLFLINQLCPIFKKYMVSKVVFRHFLFDRFSWNTILKRKYALLIFFFVFTYRFLKIFQIRRYMTQCTFIDICRFTTISKSLRVLKFWHKMAYFDQIMLCAKIYITIKIFLFVNLQQINLFLINQLCSNF